MVKINGFKVIGSSEPVIGKVVQLSEGNIPTEFKIVEYYINEYQTYMSHVVDTFVVEPQNSSAGYVKAFKETLGQYVRIKDVFVEEEIIQLLMQL